MILTFFSVEDGDVLRIVSKLLMAAVLWYAFCVLLRCFYLFWNKESQSDTNADSEAQPELQTYQKQEIEELKKKYDAMEEKPKLYYDPYSDHVYLCKNGEKSPVGDIRYLQ